MGLQVNSVLGAKEVMRTIRDSCFIVTCLSLQLRENVKIIINLNAKCYCNKGRLLNTLGVLNNFPVINDITINVISVKLPNGQNLSTVPYVQYIRFST